MKVYLLMHSYDDGQFYESTGYEHLCKIVDSEEKSKDWAFTKACKKCYERISVLKEQAKGTICIDDDGPYLIPYSPNDPIYQNILDELYFFENQLNSITPGMKDYFVYDPNGYERDSYFVREWEVE